MDNSVDQFDGVITELREIFINKNASYGDSAFHKGEYPIYKWWMRFSDVARKATRLEALTVAASCDNKDAQKKLISDYKDLAIYAIIAVAVLEDQE